MFETMFETALDMAGDAQHAESDDAAAARDADSDADADAWPDIAG